MLIQYTVHCVSCQRNQKCQNVIFVLSVINKFNSVYILSIVSMFRNKFLVSIVLQLHFLKHFYFLIKKTLVATLCEKEVSKDPRFILYTSAHHWVS